MKKTTWIRTAAVATFVFGMAWQSHAEQRFVYVAGVDGRWLSPHIDNQSEWESLKIYETAEGSNVYEGTLSITSGFEWQTAIYFRFITKLSDNYSYCWRENFVGPVYEGTYADVKFDTRSGIAYTTQLNVKEFSTKEPGAWIVTLPDGTENVKFHLDLNKNEMWAVSNKSVIPVFNSNVKPTVSEAARMMAFTYNGSKGVEYFVPSGNCEFKMYNAYHDTFAGPDENTTIAGTKKSANLTYSNSNDASWTIDNWAGGILKLSNGYTGNPMSNATLKIDNASQRTEPLPKLEDMDYLVVVTPDDDIEIDAKNFSYVVGNFPKLSKTDANVYVGDLSGQNAVRFLKKVGATPAENEYVAPGAENCYLNYRRGVAYSSYNFGKGDSGYWTNAVEARKAKVNLNSSDVTSVQFGEENNEPSFLYVVGTNSDWAGPSAANLDFYQNHRIFSTTDGKYYGSIDATKKDSNGNVSFRLFTDLKGWTSETSIGSYYDDFYELQVTCDEGEYNLYKTGLGNFCFSNYTGDKIYILADLANSKVKFSSIPLDVTIGVKGDSPICYLVDSDENIVHGDDVLSILHTAESDELLIHSRNVPFPRGEKEWWGSYLLEPADYNAKLTLNYGGVARIALKEKNEVSDVRGNGISLANLPYGRYIVKVSPDNSELIVYEQYRGFLLGEPTDNKRLTIQNAEEFKDYTFAPNLGGVYYIPAGKFDFYLGTLLMAHAGSTHEVEWEDGFCSFEGTGFSNLSDAMKQRIRFVDADWHGGWIALTAYGIIDLTKAHEIETAVNYGAYPMYRVGNTEDMTYRASNVRLTRREDNAANISFIIKTGDTFRNLASAPAFYDYQYGDRTVGDYTASLNGDRVVLPVAISYVGYYFPDVKDATVDVTLNLKDMTMTLDVAKVDELSKFGIYSNDENVDGSEAVETFEDEHVMQANVNVPETDEDVEVNFVTADNKIISPVDEDLTVYFDEHGNYASVYTLTQTSAGSRRRAAGQAHRWIIPSRYSGGNITFKLYEQTRTLHIASEKALKHYYVVDGDEDYGRVPHSVFDLLSLSDRMLRQKSENVYEGVMTLPDNKLMSIIGGSTYAGNVNYAVGPRVYGDPVVDMSSTEDEVIYLIPTGYWTAPWKLDGYKADTKCMLRLDLNNYTLTIMKDLSAIDQVKATYGMNVEAETGGLRITSEAESLLPIYNLQGTQVKLVNVMPGVTMVQLPAGLYIAAGKKVMVR